MIFNSRSIDPAAEVLNTAESAAATACDHLIEGTMEAALEKVLRELTAEELLGRLAELEQAHSDRLEVTSFKVFEVVLERLQEVTSED